MSAVSGFLVYDLNFRNYKFQLFAIKIPFWQLSIMSKFSGTLNFWKVKHIVVLKKYCNFIYFCGFREMMMTQKTTSVDFLTFWSLRPRRAAATTLNWRRTSSPQRLWPDSAVSPTSPTPATWTRDSSVCWPRRQWSSISPSATSRRESTSWEIDLQNLKMLFQAWLVIMHLFRL